MIIVAMASSTVIAFMMMFIDNENLTVWIQQYKAYGDFYRKLLLFMCFVVYFFRLCITLVYFFRRKLYWTEAIIITNIMPFIIPYTAYVGGNNHQQVGLIEGFGIFLFLLGSCLNTISEYLRHIWKNTEKNKGLLYTGGLFKYAIHINYLGDIILFSGIALIGNVLILLFIPGLMGFIFIIIVIPLKESYLKKKYGNDFINYKSSTKKLIPFIY